jgi:type II secretion system protein N
VAGRLIAGGEGQKTTLSADFKDVVLKRGMLVKQLFGFEVSGKMGGHAEAELGEKLSGSRGKLTLEVTGGQLSGIDHEAIPLETVKFKHLNLECDLAAGKIVVRRADIKDGEMTNKLSGLVVLADSVMESRLDLRGNLAFSDYVVRTNELEDELPDKGKKGLPYIVSGTLRTPKFALDLGGPKAAGEACEEDDDLAADEEANGDEEGPTVSGLRGVRRAPAAAVPPAARYRYQSGSAAPRPPVAAAGRE